MSKILTGAYMFNRLDMPAEAPDGAGTSNLLRQEVVRSRRGSLVDPAQRREPDIKRGVAPLVIMTARTPVRRVQGLVAPLIIGRFRWDR